MPALGSFLLLASFVVCATRSRSLASPARGAVAAADRERHRRVLPGRRADDRRLRRDRPRLRHRRLLDQVRPALLGFGAAAGLQDHLVLGRARRLDHVLGVPAVDLRVDRRLRQPRAPPRADSVRRRHHLRRADVLPLPDGGAQEPVHDVPDAGAGGRQGAEPAAAELLHGDPSAVALHRLRRR